MEEIILQTKNLTKLYGAKAAVDNVSITINKGDIYGFVGLNGSGKTTFMRLITSLASATSGTFSLFGKQGAEATKSLSRIASVVETPAIYLDMNARENLAVQTTITNTDKSEIVPLLTLVGLDPNSPKKAKDFSLGMRQRLGLAMALCGQPEFMILDEPTNGLDPNGIVEIRELLKKLNQEKGVTILVSSHILGELSRLATRFGFIHNGRVIREATNEEVHSIGGTTATLTVSDPEKAAKVLEKVAFVRDGASFTFDDDIAIGFVLKKLVSADIEIISVKTHTAELEDFFLNLIKEAR